MINVYCMNIKITWVNIENHTGPLYNSKKYLPKNSENGSLNKFVSDTFQEKRFLEGQSYPNE